MYKIVFTEDYEKRAKKFFKKHNDLIPLYEKTLKLLELNPYHPSLRLHKVNEVFSVSINMKYRILLDFIIEDNVIIPLTLGTHGMCTN